MSKISLNITLDEDCGRDFLLNASIQLNPTSSKDLTSLLPKGKPIRALIIAMLLAKHLGEEVADKLGLIILQSDIWGLNWINTLAGFLPSGAQTTNFFNDHFDGIQFIRAGRGTTFTLADGSKGGKPPIVKYNSLVMPLANLRFFKKAKHQMKSEPLKPEELSIFASNLEAFQVQQGNDWQSVIPEILKLAENRKCLKSDLSQDVSIPMADGMNSAFCFNITLRPIIRKLLTPTGEIFDVNFEFIVKKD